MNDKETGRLKVYQVDAFTDRLFSGNPAAVCVMEQWLTDETMQSIANENNLPETAFVVPSGDDFGIRWFTPTIEVDLCGHATLAAAFVLYDVLQIPGEIVRFYSPRSGWLPVRKKENRFFLDFPVDELVPLAENEFSEVAKCIGTKPLLLYKGRTDYLAVVGTEKSVMELLPDFKEISKLNARGLIVTAKGESADFVSRFFAPQSGIDEDPVTGSAHTSLIPLWSEQLGRNKFVAKQLSKRGGQLFCELQGDRCIIGGNARLFLTGEIFLEA